MIALISIGIILLLILSIYIWYLIGIQEKNNKFFSQVFYEEIAHIKKYGKEGVDSNGNAPRMLGDEFEKMYDAWCEVSTINNITCSELLKCAEKEYQESKKIQQNIAEKVKNRKSCDYPIEEQENTQMGVKHFKKENYI